MTKNLPFRSHSMTSHECFQAFIHAIFYVGKGKRSRPYSHLYEALEYYKGEKTSKVRLYTMMGLSILKLTVKCNICTNHISFVPHDRTCAPKCSISCRCGTPGRVSSPCIVFRMLFQWRPIREKPALWKLLVSTSSPGNLIIRIIIR